MAVRTVATGQANRLTTGGLIDRRRTLAFEFDGRRLTGYAGDTLASALVANGVRLVGRSFKYHRPRGLMTAGSDEPNGLVELGRGARREPNSKASTIELYDNLEATSQNRFPSLAFDLGAVNSLLSPLLVAGFYYKTFMWPAAFWEKVYEPLIRRAAGLGRASLEPDPDRYEKATAFCDLLVIGAGPAGLATALTAGRSGLRVILCDEDFLPGGRLNAERLDIDGVPGGDWAARAAAELETLPEVRVMRRATVFGVYDGSTYGVLERVSDHLPAPPPRLPRQCLWHIVARRAVLAAGALERPIVFGNNDRPGIMLASAVRTYVNRFAAVPGRRLAIFTTTDDGWKTVADLGAAGLQIAAVIDARKDVRPAIAQTAAMAKAPIFLGGKVVDASGGKMLRGVTVVNSAGKTSRIACDGLAMAGGWTPTIALATHLGNRAAWSNPIAAFVPGKLPPGMEMVGAASGSFSLAAALREGTAAGLAAAESVGATARPVPVWRASDEAIEGRALWHVAESRAKAFVDFQNDVTDVDIKLSAREGFNSVELLKRYTTLGMATDQGKTSNLNGHAILATLMGKSIPEVGTTIVRPPYTPVAIAAFAGHHRGRAFRPKRLTAGHAWAVEQGAHFVEASAWMRAQWFARPGEADWIQTVSREVRTVREQVGVCDVSTLGKIDIQGADAGLLLDRVYINLFSNLPIGRVRYGLMLREDGLVMDDGTTARLDATRYVMSTTTANAERVMQHLEHARQVIWPTMDVQIVSVTDQWAQYSIAGPRARDVLAMALADAVDISNANFSHLACAEFIWRGVPARLFRVSFSGELAYELAVPARYADAVARTLMEAGREFGIVPYGTEALGVMRIEKGHVAGNEMNGTTTAVDLGLGRMMSKKKDFIGRVLANRPALTDVRRPRLVGLKPVDRSHRFRAGAHLLSIGAPTSIDSDQGYISSVAFSPSLGHWIGLGFLSHGSDRFGERVRAYDAVREGDVAVEICAPIFLDPEGRRVHG